MAAHEPLRRIGPFSVGAIGFGCWRLTTPSTAEAATLVEAAVDMGCTLVDTADVYGLDWGGTGFGTCEERLGDVLRVRSGLRDRMVLATKGGIIPGVPYDSSPGALTAACEASLRRLGVDHVDLYQVHRPDMFAHPAEVAATLTSLRERGLVREVGVSNHTTAQTAALQAHLPFPLASTQPEFSAACTQPMRDGTLDLAMQHGTAVLAWSPLAGGRLATGHGLRPELTGVLDDLATQHGASRSEVALAFVLAHPSAPVAIIGTQRIDRVAEAVRATQLHLSRAEVYAIVQASEGAPLP
jgi:predicted oxidoreductase